MHAGRLHNKRSELRRGNNNNNNNRGVKDTVAMKK